MLGTCRVDDVDAPVPVPPDQLAKLRFPNGKPLSPALSRWLAFDARWLGWFDHPARPVLRPQTLGEYAEAEYEWDWGSASTANATGFTSAPIRAGCCTSASRTRPASIRSCSPTDDNPCLGVAYPGIDVYLAVNAGVIDFHAGVYGAMLDHRVYGPRMREHANRHFGGKCGDAIAALHGDPRQL